MNPFDNEIKRIIRCRKPNHCRTCGRKIEGPKYNPYNVSFKHYECQPDDKKMCLKCAEKFVKQYNKFKGGVWEVRTVETNEEENKNEQRN